MSNNILRILVGFTFGLLASATALAQGGGGFSLTWTTIDGGGGPSSGASFSINGTIGQPSAGAMSGGAFTVSGGFWYGVSNTPPGPGPGLSIRLGTPIAGVNTVILSWPNPSTGYVLQQTANMNDPGGWTNVPQTPVINGANKEVTLQATGSFCLFRLRQ